MEVTETPVNLGKVQCLIQNKSGDPIHVGEYGQDQDDWFELEVGSAVTVKAYNNGVGVVSDGVSEVGVLIGGTGIFPPSVEGVGANVYGQPQPITTVAGTSHTIASAQAGNLHRCTSNSAVTITAPKDVTDDVPDGVYFDIEQVGDGQVTVVAEDGATITPLTDFVFKTRVKGSRIGLQKVAANTWSIFGDLEGA